MVLKHWPGDPPPGHPEGVDVFAVEFWLGSRIKDGLQHGTEAEREAVVELLAKVVEGFVTDYWTGDCREHTNGEVGEGQKLTVFQSIGDRLADQDGDPLSRESPFVAVVVAAQFAEKVRNLVGAMV
jgi:hypothetical protein